MLNGNNSGSMLQRRVCNYENCCDRFVISNKVFETQYAPFYNIRLSLYSDALKMAAEKKWGSDTPVKKLCDISVGDRVAVIGTLCKHMEMRPSILKEISDEHHLVPQAVVDEYASESDYLILEDDSQRITLKGDVDAHCHVTGIIVAVLGCEEEDGKFLVEDICYSSLSNPCNYQVIEVDTYIMLVSGLGLRSADVLFPLRLLVDYVTGVVGCEADQQKASNIARVIVAGNALGANLKEKDFSSKAKYLTRKTKSTTVEGIKILDQFLSCLVPSVDVDIMPGEFDPANHLLPQQPFHPCMFPKSATYSTFHPVTNPYEALIEGIRILGTSGQNIKDIMAYSRLDDPVEIMVRTLQWGHLSPTAPDTLNCYPYIDKDPFVINECPHVYFAGNMRKFGTRKFGTGSNRVTVISVPKFCETFTAVLVNLRTSEVEPFTFQV